MVKQHEIIYGIHPVEHALGNDPNGVLEMWIQDTRKSAQELAVICRSADITGISIQYVTRKALDRLAGTTAHQGVAIRHKTTIGSPVQDLDTLLNGIRETVPLLLILDGVQDPHNLGACLRSADAAGVDGVVIPKDRAVQVNATVRKVASGAAEHIPVIPVTNLARCLTAMRAAGIWVFGTADDAAVSLFEVDLTVPVAIVLGAEGKGLRRNTRDHCDQLLKIPMQGRVESLNVSVAAGVCLFEAVRQRAGKK